MTPHTFGLILLCCIVGGLAAGSIIAWYVIDKVLDYVGKGR